MSKTKIKNQSLKRLIRFYYLKVMRINATPHKIALGAACGVFGGCFPFIPGLPLQTVIAVICAFITRSSKIAAIIATWISNPLNWLFFYFIQYKIGTFLLPITVDFNPDQWKVSDFMAIGWKGVTILIFGGFILGIPLGIISYFAAKFFIQRYRKRKALRTLARRNKL
ncbi:DUF2062 domain-containing protein [Maridesulfovibrio bastinii]|uniref:DUF2062 domain-containing protein n=1 Tax=Maridesulfovibrio bastinii TaxID=47157 RepID=UPI0003F68793|nr:DUF2062 domain-containing protein [Maridesulfovibrio bastinii]